MTWFLQTLLLGPALMVAIMLQAPATAIAGFGVAAAALIFRAAAARFARGEGAALAAVWIGSLTVWVSVAGRICLDSFYAVPAGLTAMAVWMTARQEKGEVGKARWNAVVLAWLLCGAGMWLGGAYVQNKRGEFYAGILPTLAVLALCRLWFRWGAPGAQVMNTCMLLLAGLPAVDLMLPMEHHSKVRPETWRLYYSYDAAKGDRVAFMRWMEFYYLQFDHLKRDVFMRSPDPNFPFMPRPGSRGSLMNCPIAINSLGFRGPEFPVRKKGVYRIVTLGESTTFGMTFEAGHKPWPELLEEIIRQRLKTRLPVQVINAGVPGYAIIHNLARLPRDILPLQPDMIISYHGANGFYLIDPSLLPPMGPPMPVYHERALRLGADAEHRLHMLLYRYRARRQVVSATTPTTRPLETRCAAAYRRLIECARTNGIRLVLANYSMAANQASSQGVMDFYNGNNGRTVDDQVRANPIHSLIVSQLAAENPEVCFVDTHPHLDGEHEKFIDILHFTREGDEQLAENMFAGIRKTLEQDLTPP